MAKLEILNDETPEALEAKEKLYRQIVEGSGYESARLLHDTWCAAFVWPKEKREYGTELTTEHLRKIERNPHSVPPSSKEKVREIAQQYRFFHWHLEFPAVFGVSAKGGFDVILGNPPWERPKPEPAKYFAAFRPDISNAQTSAVRDKMLAKLKTAEPDVFAAWAKYERYVMGCVHFQTNSGRFPLSAVGKFNLGNTFVEQSRRLLASNGRAGLLNVSGLATDDSGKVLIAELMQSSTLVNFYDFENRKGLFPAVDSRYKFSAITVAGSAPRGVRAADFFFFAQTVDDLHDSARHVEFSVNDIRLLNPLSGNCPVFRERRQAEMVKAIYRRAELRQPPAEVLWDWDAEPTFLFVMSDHSSLFSTRETLGLQKFDEANIAPVVQGEQWLPLYESKMFHQFQHRWANLDTEGTQHDFSLTELSEPICVAIPRYWMREADVARKLRELPHPWLIALREVTNATNERTSIAAVIPKYPVGHNAQVFRFNPSAREAACFVSCLNSFLLDFATRTKVGGSHLSSFILRQLPILPARDFGVQHPWVGKACTSESWLVSRVLELTYTAWDLELFARDCDFDGPPFRWDEERRFQLRCELDAAFFHLYLGSDEEWRCQPESLTKYFPRPRDAVPYIMDTFPIVKRKDEEKFGTYRAKDTILALYDALAESQRTGQPYASPLHPAPGPPTDEHGHFIPMSQWDPNHWPAHIHPPRKERV
jgi:hypothetical protein